MTTSTFMVLVAMTALTAAGILGLVRSLRSARAGRPGAGAAAAAAGLLAASFIGPLIWQIGHYFDLRDGSWDGTVPSAPFYWIAGILLVAASVSALAALVQRLARRRKTAS
jgi:hypothetical protein